MNSGCGILLANHFFIILEIVEKAICSPRDREVQKIIAGAGFEPRDLEVMGLAS